MESHVVLLCSDLRQTNRAAVSSERVNTRRAPVCPPTSAIQAERLARRYPADAARPRLPRSTGGSPRSTVIRPTGRQVHPVRLPPRPDWTRA